uniref:Cecropin n=1 Tax=Simulium vittatum TaxID=7192 RepID=B5M0M7_SIMVI|nr:cecropin precursor [Simulium vittatum]
MNFQNFSLFSPLCLLAIFGQADAKFKDKLKRGAKKALDIRKQGRANCCRWSSNCRKVMKI